MSAPGKHMRVDVRESVPAQRSVPRRQQEGVARSFFAALGCLLLSVGVVALVCFLQTPTYATTADFEQALYARGALYGITNYLMPHSLIFFSAPLCMVYSLFPSIPWYPVALLALQAVSFAVMLNLARKIEASGLVRAFAMTALVCCEVMVTACLSYQIAAFVMFACGMSLVVTHAGFTRPRFVRLGDVLGYLLIVEGFALCPESGLLAAALFVPFFVWACIHNHNVRTLLMLVGVAVCVAVTFMVGRVAWDTSKGWERFGESAEVVQSIANHPRVSVQEAQGAAPALSSNDLDMVYEGLAIDTDVFDLATLKSLDGAGRGYGIDTMMESILARQVYSAFVLGLLLMVLASAVVLGVGCGFGWRSMALLVSEVIMLLGMLMLGYARARTEFYGVLPLVVVALFAIIVAALNDDEREVGRRSDGHVMAIFPLVGMLAFVAVTALVEVRFVRPAQRDLGGGPTAQMDAYVQQHPDQYVVFTQAGDGLLNYNAIDFERWQQPGNVVLIGGGIPYTAPWKVFLRAHRLEGGTFFAYLLQDGDFMVTVGTEWQARMLATYLGEHSGETVSVERVETLGTGLQSGEECAVWRYASAATEEPEEEPAPEEEPVEEAPAEEAPAEEAPAEEAPAEEPEAV